jgi:hypothetical protein
VDFYLYATHEVATATPVLEALQRRGVDVAFVLEPPERHLAWGSAPDPTRGWLDDKHGQIGPLVNDALHRELTGLVRTGTIPLVDVPRRDAAVAITTQGRAWLRRYDCAYARLGYGVAFAVDSYGHGEINRGFDLVLAHGEFSASAIRAHVPGVATAAVGYPKWAAYLRGDVTKRDARRSLGIDSRRPVLLYAPTWAHRASLEAMLDVLPCLAREWHVVVKPHHNTSNFELARLEAIDQFVVASADPATRNNLVSYIAAADVVIADALSGAFTESLLARRPVVGVVTGGAAALHSAAARCAPIVSAPREITTALDSQPWERWQERAGEWVPNLFTSSGGNDHECAADAIVACASLRSTRLRRRTENRVRQLVGPVKRRLRTRTTTTQRPTR